MIKLIVGLGNPGDRYQKTRHNAGFWLLDQLVASEHSRLAEDKKFQSEYGKIFLANHSLHLLKPLTFMNASGRAVSAAAKFYDIAPEEILVVHDEVDLAEGQLNFKEGGGLNSHNGLRSIADKLQTRDFMRLQFGIGRPPGKMPVADYVLRELKGNNLEDFLVTAQAAADQVEQLLRS